MEILIALALILIVGGLAAANLVGIANGIDHLPPAKVLQAGIRDARFMAMSRMSTVMLTYNGDGKSFDILDDKGNVLVQMSDGNDDPNSNITLTVTPILPQKDIQADVNSVTEDSAEYAKQTSSRIIFHPSGATTPSKITLTQNEKDMAYLLDPFSEGPPPKLPEDIPALPN